MLRPYVYDITCPNARNTLKSKIPAFMFDGVMQVFNYVHATDVLEEYTLFSFTVTTIDDYLNVCSNVGKEKRIDTNNKIRSILIFPLWGVPITANSIIYQYGETVEDNNI